MMTTATPQTTPQARASSQPNLDEYDSTSLDTSETLQFSGKDNLTMASNIGSVEELETLATAMYSSPDAEQRRSAFHRLSNFQKAPGSIAQCQALLEHSKKPEAQMLASSSLLELLTSYWKQFQVGQTVDISNYLLNYLSLHQSAADSKTFVNAAIIRTICRVTKLGWSADQRHRDICKNVMKFLESTNEHKLIGMQILVQLVGEMVAPLKGMSLADNRKAIIDFRNKALLDIFRVSFAMLEALAFSDVAGGDDADKLQSQATLLFSKCLTANHVGTQSDEALEEYGSLMIPDSWKEIATSSKTIDVIVHLLFRSRHPLTVGCLDALCQMVRMRRTIFADQKSRVAFLNHFAAATLRIVENSSTLLSDPEALKAFARLLGNIKSTYQLSDLVAMPLYQKWLQQLASFTVSVLRAPVETDQASALILNFWSSVTKAIRFTAVKEDVDVLVREDSIVTEMCRTYIAAQLESLERVVKRREDDEFFDQYRLDLQLESMPVLFRHDYPSSMASFLPMLNDLLSSYKTHVLHLQKAATRVNDTDAQRLLLLECRLALLMRIAGLVLGKRSFSIATRRGTDAAEYSALDARLAFTIFQCLETSKSRSQLLHESCRHVELAFILFCDNVRDSYLFDLESASASRKATATSFYETLSMQSGRPMHPNDLVHVMVLAASNKLKSATEDEELIEKSIQLLNTLASDDYTAALMIELDVVNNFLLNHGELNFEFMKHTSNLELRSQFYSTWGRGVLSVQGLPSFPSVCTSFTQLLQRMSSMDSGQLQSPVVRAVALPMCYDLSGIISSSKSYYVATDAFKVVFRWLQPHLPVCARLLQLWYNDGEGSCAVLRLLVELSTHSSKPFSIGEPDSAILCKLVCTALKAFGDQLLQDENAVRDIYTDRLKSVAMCMDILSRCLRGDFFNVGMLLAYQDTIAVDLIRMYLHIIAVKMPLNEIILHEDIARKYFELMGVLFEYYFEVVAVMDARIVQTLIGSLVEGMISSGAEPSGTCVTALGKMVSFIFRHSKRRINTSETFEHVQTCLKNCPDLLPNILEMMMDMALFEQHADIYRMSLPILGLLLTNHEAFERYSTKVVAAQSPPLQKPVMQAFFQLMKGVESTLGSRNVLTFSANLQAMHKTLTELGAKPVL